VRSFSLKNGSKCFSFCRRGASYRHVIGKTSFPPEFFESVVTEFYTFFSVIFRTPFAFFVSDLILQQLFPDLVKAIRHFMGPVRNCVISPHYPPTTFLAFEIPSWIPRRGNCILLSAKKSLQIDQCRSGDIGLGDPLVSSPLAAHYSIDIFWCQQSARPAHQHWFFSTP